MKKPPKKPPIVDTNELPPCPSCGGVLVASPAPVNPANRSQRLAPSFVCSKCNIGVPRSALEAQRHHELYGRYSSQGWGPYRDDEFVPGGSRQIARF